MPGSRYAIDISQPGPAEKSYMYGPNYLCQNFTCASLNELWSLPTVQNQHLIRKGLKFLFVKRHKTFKIIIVIRLILDYYYYKFRVTCEEPQGSEAKTPSEEEKSFNHLPDKMTDILDVLLSAFRPSAWLSYNLYNQKN